MGQWSLPGPDAPVLSKQDVLALLRISGKTLDRMVRENRFPPGIKPSPNAAPLWTGADLAAWLHLSGRMQGGPAAVEEGVKKDEE